VVFLWSFRFHAVVNPLPPLGRVDVIDLHADGAGINGASFASVLPFAFEFGGFAVAEEAEGVEIGCEVSPLTVGGEDAFALGVGGFGDGGAGAAIGRF
jgi:hypothetical protein